MSSSSSSGTRSGFGRAKLSTNNKTWQIFSVHHSEVDGAE